MDRRVVWFCALLVPVLAWSLVRPHDYFTWFLEVVPLLLGVPLILAVQRRFPLSTLPLGEWAKGWFGWTRNDYDKLGHFAQGFVPAILTREILLRTSPLRDRGDGRPSRWLPFLCGSVCMGFSALYELFEWLMAISSGTAADDFLGTQGDPWDTQTDMAMALVGAVCALTLMTRWHDRSLARLRKRCG